MPSVRLMIMQAEFATAAEASAVIGGLMNQFRGEPNQVSLPEPSTRHQAAALPTSLATGEDAPPPVEDADDAEAAAPDLSPARGSRRKAAPEPEPDPVAVKSWTVSGAIRHVLVGRGAMTPFSIYKAVSELLDKSEPRKRTTPETVNSLLYQFFAKGEVDRVGDGYALKGGK